MKILEKLFLCFNKAKLVGKDYYGNSYYLLKDKDAFGRQLRYIEFFKKKNISSIPPLWSAWLRYSINDIENVEKLNDAKQPFVKLHQPNLTGVDGCYYPTNHILSGRNRKENAKKSEIYHSWLDI